MKRICALLSSGLTVMLLALPASAATLREQVVFEAGEFCPYYRIPAIVEAANKDLIAFAECRLSYRDHQSVGIVSKRSRFDETTNSWGPWGDHQFVAAGLFEGKALTNPTPIVNYWGAIVLLYSSQQWDQSQGEIRQCSESEAEHCARRTHRLISYDHGATWTDYRDITDQIRRPGARWGAEGPGHGITLLRGPHAGRLVATHVFNFEGAAGGGPKGFDVIYSDNWGFDWQRGAEFTNSGDYSPTESMPVELFSADGSDSLLYITSRNRKSEESTGRGAGICTNGGETRSGAGWVEASLPVVPDGGVQGSILRYSATALGHSRDVLVLATPADGKQRRNLRLHHHNNEASEDGWSAGKLVHRGPAGYSDLVKLHDGYAGMVYEASSYRTEYTPYGGAEPEDCNGKPCYSTEIKYARFNEPWFVTPVVLQYDFRRRSTDQAVTTTVRDFVGNGLHGTPSGAPVAKDGPASYGAKAPRSLRFDGVDDYIRIPASPLASHILDFEPEDDFTIEVIFRTTAHGTGGSAGSGPLFSKDVGPQQSSYWLRIQDGVARFFMDDSSQTTSVRSPENVTDGAWHHLAVVRDRAAGKVYMYLDHDENPRQAVTDTVTGTIANTNDILVGSFNSGSSANRRRFKGDIALVRVSLAALDPGAFVKPD